MPNMGDVHHGQVVAPDGTALMPLLDSLIWKQGDLESIACVPTLLIGEDSPVLPEDVSPDSALQALLPMMKTKSIPGQGHVAYLTDPNGLAAIVAVCLGSG